MLRGRGGPDLHLPQRRVGKGTAFPGGKGPPRASPRQDAARRRPQSAAARGSHRSSARSPTAAPLPGPLPNPAIVAPPLPSWTVAPRGRPPTRDRGSAQRPLLRPRLRLRPACPARGSAQRPSDRDSLCSSCTAHCPAHCPHLRPRLRPAPLALPVAPPSAPSSDRDSLCPSCPAHCPAHCPHLRPRLRPAPLAQPVGSPGRRTEQPRRLRGTHAQLRLRRVVTVPAAGEGGGERGGARWGLRALGARDWGRGGGRTGGRGVWAGAPRELRAGESRQGRWSRGGRGSGRTEGAPRRRRPHPPRRPLVWKSRGDPPRPLEVLTEGAAQKSVRNNILILFSFFLSGRNRFTHCQSIILEMLET